MKQLLSALLSGAIALSVAGVAIAQTALDYLDIAFAATEQGDWDTAIINFRRAVEAEGNDCEADVYQMYLELAEEIKEASRTESDPAGLHQYWTVMSSEIDGDCGW